MQKQKKKEKLCKIPKIRISSFSAIFACRRDTYSNNCFYEFLKSAKNVLNDSDRKVSKVKFYGGPQLSQQQQITHSTNQNVHSNKGRTIIFLMGGGGGVPFFKGLDTIFLKF